MSKSVENKKTIKNRRLFSVLLDVFIIIVLVCVVALDVALFLKNIYYKQFWVNGESMYPTLNGEVILPDGSKADENAGNSGVGYQHLDYGLYDDHKSTLNKLKRFDVVITSFYEDDDSEKIKRLVGMPNETIKFNENGDLFVKVGNEFKLIEQPIEDKYKVAGTYNTHEITLGENEYYVLGDNRGHSSDSRSHGPIKKSYIVGKAVAIIGYCTAIEENGQLTNSKVKYKWPRLIK